MRFAYKYRHYPNRAQVHFLENQLQEASDLYNAAFQERREAWKICRKSLNYYDQAKQLKPMREAGLLGLANFSCCQNVPRQMDKTFQAFFARLHDAGWNGFFAKLWYKAASAGRELVKVAARGTSQVCVCRAAVPKTLAERWHACPECGLSAPRNVVSAQVILERARVGRSRPNVEDVVSCVPREAVAFRAT